MNEPVRVRFAPSPTGPLHIGGVRTALYNFLFAKKNKGTFILRIEDTDQNRYVEGAEQYIIDALNWCGIPYDEGPGKEGGFGPYRQSERKDHYKKYAEELVQKGKAYYAFDTAESLDMHRKEQEEKGKTFIYNWHNREKLQNSLTLTPEETRSRIEAGEEHVIRFKTPHEETVHLIDEIRGRINVEASLLDDKVLFKSDGMPTYHLANVVDDHLMKITHVIRGEEWLPSLALHKQLYDAFGWKPPVFAHLPLIMKPTGKGKLSKRDGEQMGFPVFPLSWGNSEGYREAGYFPEAVVNFLAMLGWNAGDDKEIYSLEELTNAFSLERVHNAGARFDPEKTRWFNHHYLQLKPDTELAELFRPKLKEQMGQAEEHFGLDYITQVVSLVKERADFVNDLWELSSYFFEAPEQYDEKAVKKQWKEQTPGIMQQLLEVLNGIGSFDSRSLETAVKEWIEQEGLSFGLVMAPLRLLIVGGLKGPHLFDIMALIGREKSLLRIRQGMEKLS
ncbi:glutamyl-tRNA synthetase [Muriicola jejuensis]|uniref:Glutamate--tRNA ligase n=1 Tax=Muriicola jejuensis TaxID=504488 RepID=A0A6P0UBF1_9FLAO|nr:glutamate--tRNA ligase [Muriicola jejuensis]NER09932.1 glutamate--tRNA ligase [Muriicola jejuensis]SMP04662.1 glutamyl-tRNA synthetase [Muriicola jejuensis]